MVNKTYFHGLVHEHHATISSLDEWNHLYVWWGPWWLHGYSYSVPAGRLLVCERDGLGCFEARASAGRAVGKQVSAAAAFACSILLALPGLSTLRPHALENVGNTTHRQDNLFPIIAYALTIIYSITVFNNHPCPMYNIYLVSYLKIR
jgi:hypothetical protein